jgi:AcrR family transcriptional regulator
MATELQFGGAPLDRRSRKGNREKILTAASAVFLANGYFAVSMEDIAAATGVSRMTVYRHFSSKSALAIELFERAAEVAMTIYLRIGQARFHEYADVKQWIIEIFATDRSNRQLLRVFTQANAEEAAFAKRSQNFVGDVVAELARSIPAFAVDRNKPDELRKWLEAWLLIYELLDQSNRAAWDRVVANEPLLIDIFVSRFMAFVNSQSETTNDSVRSRLVVDTLLLEP